MFHCSVIVLHLLLLISYCDKGLISPGCSGYCKNKPPDDDSESHMRKWVESTHAAEVKDIDETCLDTDYEIGLYSFTNHGSHFFIAANISSEMAYKKISCPAAIVFASLDSKKVSYQIQKQELLNAFHVHMLDKKTLNEIMIAHNKAPAIVSKDYDLTKNSCAHYAQSIWRALKIDETAELADFLITNLLRDDGLVKYAKQTMSQGGLRVMASYANDSVLFKKYVRDTVISQLEIVSSDVTEAQVDIQDFEDSMSMSYSYYPDPDLIPPSDQHEDLMIHQMQDQCPTQIQAVGVCYNFDSNKIMKCFNCAWDHLFSNNVDLSCFNMESAAIASFSVCGDICDGACATEMNDLAICGVGIKCHGVTAIA